MTATASLSASSASRGRAGALAEAIALPLAAIAVSLVLFGIFVALAGAAPLAMYHQMLRGAFGTWFTTGGSKPGTQAGPLVKVPVKLPKELFVVVPEPSFMPQRATRPAPLVISEFLVLWISA